MVFFDLGPLADAAQLHERVARVALVLGADDVGVIRLVDEPELDELPIGHEVERHEIGARLLERGILFLQHALRIALQAFGDPAGAVADHLVHVGRQLAGDAAPLLGALGFLGAPANSRRNSGSVDLS